jgi:hypothetical protein
MQIAKVEKVLSQNLFLAKSEKWKVSAKAETSVFKFVRLSSKCANFPTGKDFH